MSGAVRAGKGHGDGMEPTGLIKVMGEVVPSEMNPKIVSWSLIATVPEGCRLYSLFLERAGRVVL